MKKMNWGTGIVLILGVFFLVTAILLVIAFRQRVDLVENNYYEKELSYQDKIDKQKNAMALTEPVSFSAQGTILRIIFPVKNTGPIKNGKVLLYKASDSRSDFTVDVTPDSNGLFTCNMAGKPLGIWKAVVDWESSNGPQKGFYNEKDFRLNSDGIGPY